jgi:hypothetical protein
VLHISTTLANNLSAQVKAGNWFEVNWNTLIRPFALHTISKKDYKARTKGLIRGHTHPAQLVAPAPGDGNAAHQQDWEAPFA